jgi:hypothetical protein
MLRHAILTVVALAPCAQGQVTTAAPAHRPESILPKKTLLFLGTDDLDALNARLRSEPLGKILAEQDVKDFLAKPLGQARKLIDEGIAAAKQVPELADVELDFDKICSGHYGRAFFAITDFACGVKEGELDPQALDLGFVIGLEPRPGAVDILGQLRQVVEKFIASKGEGNIAVEKVEAGGVTYQRVKPPKSSAALCFATIGGMPVLALSDHAIEAMAAAAASPADSLAADPDFMRCVGAVGAPATGDLVEFLRAGTLIQKAVGVAVAAMNSAGDTERTKIAGIVEKAVSVSKLGALGPVYSTSRWSDGAAVAIEYHEVDPAAGGLCALAAKKPVDMALLKRVPKDALSFSIGSFDLAPIWDTIVGTLKEAAPEYHQLAMQKIHEFETQVGGADEQGNPNWDIRRDFIGAVGGRMMSISTPGAGSMLGPGADSVFWIETPKPDALEKSLGYLFALPGQLIGNPITFKEQVYGDAKLKVLDAASLGPIAMAAGSMQLTWCIHDGRFWFSTSTKAMKKALDAEKPAPPAEPAANGEPPKPKEDITAKADFAKRFVAPPEGAVVTSLAYDDTATNFENGYQAIMSVFPMMQLALKQAGINDLPFDVALLPPGETISQHLFGTVHVAYDVGRNGHLSVTRGPLGPEAVVAVVGVVAAVGGLVAYQKSQSATAERRTAARTVKRKVEGDAKTRADADLADLGASITLYIIENNKPPATLDDLTKPTPDRAKGYLRGEPLPVDPWGHAYAYTTDGKEDYTLWSFGPNGVDDKGAGDDIVRRNK